MDQSLRGFRSRQKVFTYAKFLDYEEKDDDLVT